MNKCSMQKKIESVSKKSEILTSLEPRFDSRKSFYGKAQVEDDGNSKTLYSYNTPVARVTDGKLELLPKWNFSQTTRRHVADFVKQMGVEDQYLKLKKGESRCSMQKKQERLLVKPSKKQESVFDEIDPSYTLAQTFDEILSHTNDEIVISDSGVAEALGKYAIDDAFHVTDARNEDEFVDEATSILSGSPLDGSPFTASDAEDYARELWNA